MKKILIIPCAVLIIAFVAIATADEKGITGTCTEFLGGAPVDYCSTMLCAKSSSYACTSTADDGGIYTVDLSLPTWTPPGPAADDYDRKAWRHIDEHFYNDYQGYDYYDPEGTGFDTIHFKLKAAE